VKLWHILILALALRVFASFACDVAPNYSDMLEYNQIATGTAVNPQHGYGYASFLRTIYGVFGKMNYLAVFLVQAVIGTMSVALIYYAALNISTRRAALTAALIAAIYPYFIAYGCTTMPETLVVFLILATVSVFLTPAGDMEKSTMSAIVYSLAVFVKPSCLFFLPGLLFLIKKRWRFLWIAAPLCMLAISNAPSIGSAYNFYAVHNENATGKYLTPDQLPIDYTQYTSKELYRMGILNTLRNPHAAMKVIFNKIVTVFSTIITFWSLYVEIGDGFSTYSTHVSPL
jgi:4-amino-4-deoxy-L-arabinose transferase-like glycosyltransferase